MANDLRLGLRLFARHPFLSAAAVASLALCIGANTAIFTVLNAVVLRPLPYPDADRLVVAWETSADNPRRWVAPANFLDWQRDSRSFAELAAFDSFAANLTGRGEPERLRAAGASGTFFSVLQTPAARGRTLLPSDDEPGAAPVAVLTDGLWQRLFGGADAVGQTLVLDGRPHEIVGVLPADFVMPMMPDVELWVGSDRGIPRSFPFPGDITTVRDAHLLYTVGRLAPGISRDTAQAELATIMMRLAERHPDTNAGLGANVVPLHEQVTGNVRPLLVLLQVAVAVMLMIGCANVASLLLGQAAGRRSEIATRLALGAGRRRIVRQLLVESLIVAIPGGALGVLVAVWGLEALVALAPPTLPRSGEIALDGRVLAFSMVTTMLAAVGFGLGPALRGSRVSLNPSTQQAERVVGHAGVRRWHRVLAVGELALAQVLLVGAGLLLASFVAAQRVELGFEPAGRIAADLSLSPERYMQRLPGSGDNEFVTDTAPKRQLVTSVLERVRAVSGVQAAAASFTAPMAGAPNRGVRVTDAPAADPGRDSSADFQVITPDYFRTLGISVLRGRVFAATDHSNAPPVAIVNQRFADVFFPGRDPIGRVIEFGGTSRHEIVGVVANARYRDVEVAGDPTFYVPLEQNDERWPFLTFTAWTAGDPSLVAPVFREAVRSADPLQPIARIRTYDAILDAALAPRRFNTLLIGLFAMVAIVLAAIGTYGVMAYAVSTRTREIGVRAALGASPRQLFTQVIGEGAWLTAIALVVGGVGALALTGLLASLLYQVTPRDGATFAGVAALLGAVSLMAAWLPARRAVRVNPLAVLRDS